MNSFEEACVGLIERVRPTAIIFGMVSAAGLIINMYLGGPSELSLLFAASIGAAMTKVLDDPPPPTVPASIAEKLIDKLPEV